MSSKLSSKKRILIGIPTVLITAAILIACWFLFPENVFFIVLIGLAILGMIVDHFVKRYERKKTSDSRGPS